MSEIISPQMERVIEDQKEIAKFDDPPPEANIEYGSKKATQLPQVKGFRILCAVPEVDATYESGIIKAQKTKSIEEHSTVVLFVLQSLSALYQFQYQPLLFELLFELLVL